MSQTEAGDGREEHARVHFDRPLPELLPIDHTGAVPQVEDVASVEGPMDEPARTFPRLGAT
jgi:hypothetical protein